jgi:transcriptional regulator with XRE-family HTH domain
VSAPMTPADRCRIARVEAGLSIGQAIRVSGVDGVEAIESGAQQPTPAELAALACIYGVSIAWLRNGTATPISDETAQAIGVADISDEDRGSLIELLTMMPSGAPHGR